jgi:hypothetical protein
MFRDLIFLQGLFFDLAGIFNPDNYIGKNEI